MIVATYNIRRCVGLDRRVEARRVASVIDALGADVLALQEVEYPSATSPASSSELLARTDIAYQCVLGPTLRRLQHDYGNALLVRHPLLSTRRLDLSQQGREPRGLIDALVDVDGVAVRIVATHLGLRWQERRPQVDGLIRHLLEFWSEPLVLLGDFNDPWPGSPTLRPLHRLLGRPYSPRSYPAMMPLLALDRIWVSPHRMLVETSVHQSRTARVASDHLPLVATMEPHQPLP
jgi:endonuclease/exonuclease/phosphatase family metal-dependent hydrolase